MCSGVERRKKLPPIAGYPRTIAAPATLVMRTRSLLEAARGGDNARPAAAAARSLAA
jgi:hypothetical protein